jgi:pyruvate formate lyase activating enzyme
VAVVFNIQRFSIQDGPGIRTTVFLKGCPLRCLWCSNPESQNAFPEVAHRDSLCIKCGRCVEVCEAHATSLTEKGIRIDRNICKNCGKCIEVCPAGARKFYGKEMSVDEVYQEVARDRPFYQESDGGLTVSGGEPLNQTDFVVELFKRCQSTGIHTCMDTCGYANHGTWEKVLPYTDLVLFDVKLMDPSAHKKVTGKSNRQILRSLKVVTASGVPVIVRIPVIPGINDSGENLTVIAQHLVTLGLKEVNLLPYHRFGAGKYSMLDKQYSLSELRTPDDDRLEKMVKIFESFNLNCEIVV